jgi:uncharacterized protein
VLLEFRFKNFRSFREEQVFSLVASKDKEHLGTNTIETGIKSAPNALKSAVLYGANASGKSGFVFALEALKIFLTAPEGKRGFDKVAKEMFAFDKTSELMEFEITLLLNGERYQYGIALDRDRIVKEHLLVYKTVKPQRWFQRDYDPEKEVMLFSFGNLFKGQKQLLENATRDDIPLLRIASFLNSSPIKPLWDWFNNSQIIASAVPAEWAVVKYMLSEPDGKKLMLRMLADFDIEFDDIDLFDSNQRTLASASHMSDIDELERMNLIFIYKQDGSPIVFSSQQESEGTKALMSYLSLIFLALHQGTTIVIDEITGRLHPLLVRRIVEWFNNPEINPKGAQLIFTSHDTTLIDLSIFRRDQIWFVEKNRQRESSLFSLAEFSPRKGEAIAKAYLSGRYGAIPILGDLKAEAFSASET